MCLPKSDEHKTNISLALSGKNHPNFGKSLSAETCVLISEAMKGIERSEEHKVKISVANDLTIYLYNLDGSLVNTFCSTRKVSEFFHCSHPTINKYIKNGKIFRNQWILSTSMIKSSAF
jgi:group I intron endonuclease